MAGQSAFGPQDDDPVIRHRLLTRVTTTRGEPPLKRLHKKFLALAADLDNDSPSSPDSLRLHRALLQELASFHLPLSKSRAAAAAYRREKAAFLRLRAAAALHIRRSSDEIEDLKRRLDESRVDRRHKEECEALRRHVAAQPPRSETLAAISALERDIAELEAENDAAIRTVDLRRKQFSLLLRVVDELQATIEDEQRTAAEESKPLADYDAMAVD
ncbi:THO complex subunit 7B-like [Wolffia australiana]